MDIKNTVRPLLPPTSRAFLNKSDQLENAIQALLQQNQILQEQIGMLQKQTIELQKSQDTLLRQIGYGNLEYATHDSSHSKILLVGWYGAQNFGDDLMCRTIIEHLPDNLLSVTTVLVWDNKDLPTDYFGTKVRILHYPASTWDIEYLDSNFDTIVWGGGAILDDNQFTDNQHNINAGNLFIRLNKRVLERNGHVWCIGLSSNDHLADAEYIENLNFIVNRCDHFSLRDPYSLSALQAAGIDTGNVTLCEDIAFASSEICSLPMKKPSTNKDGFRLAVFALANIEKADAYAHALESIISILERDSLNPTIDLIPFLKLDDNDDLFFEHLIGCMNKRAASRCNLRSYVCRPSQLRLEQYDAVLSSKYHAALIALIQQVPTLCIYDQDHPHYKNKMTHLAELAEMPQWAISLNEFFVSPIEQFKPLAQAMETKTDTFTLNKTVRSSQEWLNKICSEITV